MVDAWKKGLEGLEKWMTTTKVDKDIIDCIMNTLRNRANTCFAAALEDTSDALLRKAAEDQDNIGWTEFLEGKISRTWGKLFKHRMGQTIQARPHATVRKWRRELVEHLLHFTHELWITRNSIVHERDRQGLLVAEAQELEEGIAEQF